MTSVHVANTEPPLTPTAGESLDSICGGAVELLQRQVGYRFNLDPILLAHFAASAGATLRGPTMDLGAGIGIIALILARKFGRTEITALEVQPSLFQLAMRNVQRNRAEQNITPVLGDMREVQGCFPPSKYVHIICNPPYRAVDCGRVSPDEERAIARHEILCSIHDVAAASAYLLREHGALSAIYPAARLCELLDALRRYRLEPKQLRMVHPRPGTQAKLVLVHAVKGGGPQLQVDSPLILHAEGFGGFSAEVRKYIETTP